MSLKNNLKKFFRYSEIYGFSRTLNKLFGRSRNGFFRKIYFSFPEKEISIIGCGQFAFSTISYFLSRERGNVFLDCFDININNANSLHRYYKFKSVAQNPTALLSNPKLKILYIASNHASHTYYAIEGIKAGVRRIYIEKPISTSFEQFVDLIAYKRKFNVHFYVGYNRPFSEAMCLLTPRIQKGTLPITFNCFVSGHLLEKDHWYRNSEEGTRVCGNLGHWLDLSIHLLAARGLPNSFIISILYSNLEEPDDNFSIGLSSDYGDLISIVLTSRSEPFEGINETINLQHHHLIAKIDDFRKITIWQDDFILNRAFSIKDVGHKKAVLQPYSETIRNWDEVELSTLLILHIAEMVRNKQNQSHFDIQQHILTFDKTVETKIGTLN